MMDWTDRHCRYFHRLLSRHALLYTEMVNAGAVLHGGTERQLRFDAQEQPVALQFVDGSSGAISFAPCYVGDDTLLQSLWRTLCADNVQAVVQFGTPELAQGRDRRAWASDLRTTITNLRS